MFLQADFTPIIIFTVDAIDTIFKVFKCNKKNM